MTNLQIITNEAIEQGLYTEEEVTKLFESGKILPLLTYAEWQKAGYQVKKGQKAVMQCMIWKPRKKKASDNNEEVTEQNKESFFRTKASFFQPHQVEKIEQ